MASLYLLFLSFLVTPPALAVLAVDTLASVSTVTVGVQEGLFDRRTGEARYTFTLTSTGEPIGGPLYLVLESITPAAITVLGADEVSSTGDPVFVFGVPQLGPGETLSRTIVFHNPSRLRFDLTPVVYHPAPAVNTAPVANAGPDQTVFVGDTVTLDGSGSTDFDGDPLSYHWSFQSLPLGSTAALTGTDILSPQFTVDVPGAYVVQLVVNDGQANSAPDTVTVSTQNSRPVANAGPDQTAFVGDTVTLDGTGSTDADGDPLSYFWSLLTRPADSTAALDNPLIATPSFFVDRPGSYEAELIVNDGALDSAPDRVLVSTQNSKPVADAGQDIEAYVGETVTLDGSGSHDADGDALSYFWSLIHRPEGSAAALSDFLTVSPSFMPDVEGTYVAQLIVNDGVLDSDPDTSQISVTVFAPPGGGDPTDPDEPDPNPGPGDEEPDPEEPPPDGTLPPDPVEVAPPLPETAATVLASATEFLYTGPNPIQTGVAPGMIDARRVAVIRGRISTRDGAPLAGVEITVLNHPEFGETLSRTDGAFDLAVNGGGVLTLRYRKAGYLPAQRQVQAPWQDYAQADDVVMIAKDPVVTTVSFEDAGEMQVARSSTVTDADGTRTATILFPAGTQAEIYNPDGSTRAVDSLGIRITEFTVGPNGPAAMPAPLPPTSGYTYAFSIDADEAPVKIAGKDVLFNQPVYIYAENFLGFPTGIQVPMAYYDYDKAAWIPTPDGRIIRIVGITDGLADVDTTGDGAADNGLGITLEERQQLAGLYEAGQSLQRIPVTHFSTYDPNYGTGCPEGGDCSTPQPPPPQEGNDNINEPTCQAGSIIECESQTLREVIPIAGTPYTLNYRSDLVRPANNELRIPVSGPSVASSLLGIGLEIQVAGRTFRHSLPPAPNQAYTFTFDGKDAYGREVQGTQPVSVRIIYRYPGVYNLPPGVGASFGLNSGVPVPGNVPAREGFQQTVERTAKVGSVGNRGIGTGWGLLPHHAYDVASSTILFGSGEMYTAQAVSSPSVIDSITWNTLFDDLGFPSPGLDPIFGGSAHQTDLIAVSDLAIGPDPYAGLFGPLPFDFLYIADTGNNRILRQLGRGTTGGVIVLAGGESQPGYSGDGGPPDFAMLNAPRGVAVGPDGSVYIADTGNHRIRRISYDAEAFATITTVAGNGNTAGPIGNGVPATAARLASPWGVAVGPDSSIYIADTLNHRIRRVGPDGIITTIAGIGAGYAGDGGPAMAARLGQPTRIAVAPDGSIYIADTGNNRIRRIGTDGIINTVAGNGVAAYSGDGGPATEASLSSPRGIALGRDGSLYIADTDNARIRRVDPAGIISTVVGNGDEDWTSPDANADPSSLCRVFRGDGGPASDASLCQPHGITIGPDQALYVSDVRDVRRPIGLIAPLVSQAVIDEFGGIVPDDRIHRVRGTFPDYAASYVIPSQDGAEHYVFNAAGRHSSTRNALTGALLHLFGYDPSGRLVTITDVDDNVTTIERDGAGNVTAIVAPFGQRTGLAIDANGYLTAVTNPAGESFQMSYGADGLLTAFTDPRGNTSTFTYDALGRLLTDTNAAGGSQALARTELENGGFEVTRTTSLGRTTTHRIEYPVAGGMARIDTFPDGTTQTRVIETNGATTTALADGTVITQRLGGDPRFRMISPVPVSRITTTGGLTSTVSEQRSVNLVNDALSPLNPLNLASLTESVTVNGRTSTRVYNAATRSTTTTTAASRQSVFVTDEAGRITSAAVDGLFATGNVYDAKGRLSITSRGAGADERATSFTYDALGNLASITDPLGRSSAFEYDLAGRLTTETRPDGAQIRYGYDANGNLVSIQPPGRPAHVFGFDAIDQVAEYIPPDVGAGTNSTVYTYNLDKDLTRVARPDGLAMDFSYDAAGRLASMTVPEGDFSYGYDPVTGKLTSITTPDGGGLGFIHTGELLTRSEWTGEIQGAVNFVYDNDFRIASIRVNSEVPIISPINYDADNLLVRVGALFLSRSPQNGLLTGSSFGTVTDAISYNGFGEVTQYEARVGGAAHTSWSYAYDKLGRIVQQTETTDGIVRTYSYGYDLAGRLIEVRLNGAVTAAYTYDANGNRLSRTAGGQTINGAYDDQDRLLSYGDATYSYTANGELLSKVQGGQTTGYRYDVLGNLRGVSLPDGREIEYIIDGQNRRIGKKVDGVRVQGFLYQDQLKPIAELDGDNNVVSRFVYATRVNVPDYMRKGGVTYRIITDHLGSPRIVISSAGVVVQRMEYDEYGVVTLDTNPGFQPFGFAGGLYDRDTNLVRFGARDYDPTVGKWTARDPILFEGGDVNLYSYVANSPLNDTDPSGRLPRSIDEIGECLLGNKKGLLGSFRNNISNLRDRIFRERQRLENSCPTTKNINDTEKNIRVWEKIIDDLSWRIREIEEMCGPFVFGIL